MPTQEEIAARQASIDANETLGTLHLIMNLDDGKCQVGFENSKVAEVVSPQTLIQIFGGTMGMVRELILIRTGFTPTEKSSIVVPQTKIRLVK